MSRTDGWIVIGIIILVFMTACWDRGSPGGGAPNTRVTSFWD